MASSSLPLSDFYHACRDNNIDLVKLLIETMTSDQIDKLEANGSTALHVASKHGHYEIVKLLLEKGASTSIKDRHDTLPYEQGKTEEIKVLFCRQYSSNRFVGNLNDTLEWIRIGKNIEKEAKMIRKMLKSYSNRNKNKNNKKILIEMIDLGDYKYIEKIREYFDEANKNNDPKYILQAYTEETEFYRRLNQRLASVHELDPNDENQHQLLDFLHLICSHPSFQQYELQQVQTYRGMKMEMEDLKQYTIGAKIMTKTLSSTSKARHVAEKFATKMEANTNEITTIKNACICIYQIRKTHTALDIQELSKFPHEQEVLLMPYSAFEVIDIQEIKSNSGILTEIALRQCKSDIQIYAALAAGGGGGLLAAAVGTIAALFNDDDD